jgi:hypothetical protein
MPDRLPYECPEADCGYQYCSKCVQSIKKCNSNKNSRFYCMYCNYSSSDGPQENRFLTDLLWEHFYKKYGVELLTALEIMPGTLSNDIACRLVHIELLVQTLKNKKKNITSIPGPIKSVIDDGVTLINNLKEVKKTCDRFKDDRDDNLDSIVKTYVNHLNGKDNATREF